MTNAKKNIMKLHLVRFKLVQIKKEEMEIKDVFGGSTTIISK
jgi:hypothetical protein